MQLVNIVDDEVCGARDLAVSRVLREEERESVSGQPREHGETRLELVLPIDVKPETVDVGLFGSLQLVIRSCGNTR